MLLYMRFICLLLILNTSINQSFAATDKDKWQEVKDVSLMIAEKSPLDFSQFISEGPAGRFGPIAINTKGRLEFSKSSKNVFFNCASLAWSPTTGGFPSHEQADIYARQLRLHGYNLVRFHYVDAMLMSENSGKARRGSFNFNAEQLDNWLYLLYALKKQGIYWLMDAMTAGDGALDANVAHRWMTLYGVKFTLYYDKLAQEHWKELVRRILLIKNPYTDTVIIRDNALIGIVLVNENGFNFLAPNMKKWPQDGISKDFNEWLLKKYKTIKNLNLVWRDLKNNESLENKSVEMSKNLTEVSARMTDIQQYIQFKQKNMIVWMGAFLREQGFKGVFTAFHDSQNTSDNIARANLPWIDMHNYHDASVSWDKGTTIAQTSSLSGFGAYVRVLASTRIAGKPFSLTEYGQPFWNRYRYEAAPIAASMASLQDWDFICLHASGVVDLSLRQTHKMKASILPYGGGVDPIVRAGETLSSILMLRRDIRPAIHTIKIPLSEDIAFKKSGLGVIRDFSKLAWLTRLELTLQPEKNEANISLVLEPEPQLISEMLSEKIKAMLVGEQQTQRYIELLKKKKFLGSRNESNIADGVLHSDTEQVLFNQKQGFFQIITPQTEVFVSNKPYGFHKLDVLTVNSLNVDGLLAVIALDEKPLSKSDKILIIFATDAENTGMTFADDERKQLVALGKMPPRIRQGVVDITLDMYNQEKYVLSSLHLNGDLGDRIPLIHDKNRLQFKLNNVNFTHGPTTFFLLEKISDEIVGF